MVGLDPATVQPDVAGIGEDAHPEFGGETTGDIPVVVGLAKEDQVRGVGFHSFRQGCCDRSRGQSIAAVKVQDGLRSVLTEGREDCVRAGAEEDRGGVTELPTFRQQL